MNFILPTPNNLKNIPYSQIKNFSAFVVDKNIGELSKHDLGRALYQVIVMFVNADKAYQTILFRIGEEYKKATKQKQKELFNLLGNDERLLKFILESINQKENPQKTS